MLKIFTMDASRSRRTFSSKWHTNLEEDMKAITRKPADSVGLEVYVDNDEWDKVHEILARLKELAYSGPAGQERVVELRNKYWTSELADLVSPYVYPPGMAANMQDITRIKDELKAHHIEETSSVIDTRDHLAALAHGYYVKVWQQENIIPADHADRFLLIEHRHPADAEFGTNHTLITVMDTNLYEHALEAFLAESKNTADVETTYRLVAAFRYEKLSLHPYGLPVSGTGLLLAQMEWSELETDNNPKKQVDIYHGIHLPVSVTTSQITRIDEKTNHLRFFNEQLEPLRAVTMREKRDQLLSKLEKKTGRKKGRSM